MSARRVFKDTMFACLVIAVAVLAAACAAPSAPETEAETVVVTSPPEEVEVTVVVTGESEKEVVTATPEPVKISVSTVDTQEEMLNKIADMFEERNPHITVDVLLQAYTDPGDRVKMMRTLFAAGGEPDIQYFWAQFFGNFVFEGLVYDLTPAMEADGGEWKSRFQPALLQSLAFNNRIYGVPANVVDVLMYYNKDIFDEYGLEVPETWEEFVFICETLKENGVTPIAERVGNAGVVSEWWYFVSMVPLIPEDDLCALRDGRAAFDDPRLVEAWTKIIEIYKRGYWQDGALGTSWQAGPELFIQGRTAMFVSGSWEVTNVRENADFEFGVFPIPMRDSVDQPLGVITALDQYFVSSRSEHPEEAIQFLKFLSSPEIDRMATVELGNLSTHVDVDYDDPITQQFADALALGKCRPMIVHSEMYDHLMSCVVPILEERMEPEECMKEAEELRQRLIDEGKIVD
jgi:raffinose/stachyose/melibiose transport system substrate-binding protein